MERTRLAELIAFDERRMAKHRVFETDRTLTDLYCLDPGQEQFLHVLEGSDKVLAWLPLLGWKRWVLRSSRRPWCIGRRLTAAAQPRRGRN